MNAYPEKKYPTIGVCGLDCGLCPRYYTEGTSKCPGCSGPDFFNKHPSCSFITCCVKKKGLEVCAECSEFPCPKFKDTGKYDSFLTYKKVMPNLNFIKENGVEKFIEQQEKRVKLLETMLKHFDDRRSKSFYCIAATLHPLETLEKSLDNANQKIKAHNTKPDDVKTKAKILKNILNQYAQKEKNELKLKRARKHIEKVNLLK